MNGLDNSAEIPTGVKEQSSSAITQSSESSRGRFVRAKEALRRVLPRRTEQTPLELSSAETPEATLTQAQNPTQKQIGQEDEIQLEEIREEIEEIGEKDKPFEYYGTMIEIHDDPTTNKAIISRGRYGPKQIIHFEDVNVEDPSKAMGHNLWYISNEGLRFVLTHEMAVALERYRVPRVYASDKDTEYRDSGFNDEDVAIMADALSKYLKMIKESRDYQAVLELLRRHLPEEFYVYRGQVGDYPHRRIQSYSITSRKAETFIMDPHNLDEAYQMQFREGGTIVRRKIRSDQIIGLGESESMEVIVDNGPEPEVTSKLEIINSQISVTPRQKPGEEGLKEDKIDQAA